MSSRRATSLSTVIGCFLIMTSLVEPQSTTNGPVSNNAECCSQTLVDPNMKRVFIETNRTLTPGSYPYLRVKLCTLDPVAIQLWSRVDDVTYELDWQSVVTPAQAHTALSYITIRLPNAVNITSSSRLGVYSSSGDRLPVPFDVSQTSSLFYSQNAVDNTTSFAFGQRIQLNTFRWPRTFSRRVGFCRTPDCAEWISDNPGSTTPWVNDCCQVETAMSCDPGPAITDGLTSQSGYLRNLQQDLDRLNKIMNTMVSQKYVTGLCPQGFLSGSYGVGSCYILFQTPTSMADAVLVCSSYSAKLLTIESSTEDDFLKNFVQNNTLPGQSGLTKFWTTGLYSQSSRSWTWYSGTNGALLTPSSGTDISMYYSNWLNATAPVPSGSLDICLTAVVNSRTNVVYWTNDFCSRKYYFICEVPKQCM